MSDAVLDIQLPDLDQIILECDRSDFGMAPNRKGSRCTDLFLSDSRDSAQRSISEGLSSDSLIKYSRYSLSLATTRSNMLRIPYTLGFRDVSYEVKCKGPDGSYYQSLLENVSGECKPGNDARLVLEV